MNENTLPIRPISQDGSLDSQALPEIDFASVIGDELANLKSGLDNYNERKDKPNTPLLEARAELARLQALVRDADARLKQIEAEGSYLQQFENQVLTAESRLRGFLDRYKNRVIESIIVQWFGRKVPWQKLSPERRSELEQHQRVHELRKFIVSSPAQPNVIETDAVIKQAKAAADRLRSDVIARANYAGISGAELIRVKADADKAAVNAEHDILVRAKDSNKRLEADLLRRAIDAGDKLEALAAYIASDSKR